MGEIEFSVCEGRVVENKKSMFRRGVGSIEKKLTVLFETCRKGMERSSWVVDGATEEQSRVSLEAVIK